MKNIRKLICLCFCIIVCFSLCSCDKLDALRKQQAFYDENQNIVVNNAVYKPIPYCEDFAPDLAYDKNIYITEKDVPVLLMDFFGEYAYISDDNLYLSIGDESYYARSDIYESIASRIEAGDYFDGYCFVYGKYTLSEDSYFEEYQYFHKMLSEDLNAVITDVLSNGTPEEIDVALLEEYYVLDIMLSSNDNIFLKYAASIYQTDKYIYISTNSAISTVTYRIPEKYVDVFKELIADFDKLDMSYDEFYETTYN